MKELYSYGVTSGINSLFVGTLRPTSNANIKLLESYGSGDKSIIVNDSSLLKGYKGITISDSFFSQLKTGDILAMFPTNRLEILYDSKHNDNSLFITETCNANCLSCPQPPKNNNDFEFFFDINSRLIKELPEDCEYLGITGGEPLMAKKYLFETLELLNEKFNSTEIQILSNGILLNNKYVLQNLIQKIDQKYIFGIPILSDISDQHDFLVRQKDAFTNTLNGIYSLAKYLVRIEIRILLTKQTIQRLPSLAKYIFKNLPFVTHVAFMGLEHIGNAAHNWHLLNLNLPENSYAILESMEYLDRWNIPVSLYNIPLCVIPDELHKYCVNSISRWKVKYSEECERCEQKKVCGGLFGTSTRNYYKLKAY